MKKSGDKLIVVLGMHRSGTSVVTRGLQVMGVDLGNKLMPPVDGNNKKGFWEDMDIYSLNIEMLDSINSDWHYLTPIQHDEVNTLRKKGYIRQAVKLVKEKTSGIPVFGFKDPRVTRLLPFWNEVFIQSRLNVSYVLTLRHPLSVCKSLQKRDGFDLEKGCLLWVEHMISSFTGTEGKNRILVDYDRLMASPEAQLKRIAKALQLQIDSFELEKFKTEFLDPELQHSVFQLNDLMVNEAISPLAQEIYSESLKAAINNKRLDSISFRKKIAQWSEEFFRQKSALVLTDKLISTIASMNKALLEKEEIVQTLSSQIADEVQTVQTLSTQIMEHETRITEREIELAEIRKSRAWKIALLFRQIRVILVPPNSFRARMLRFLFKIVVSPFRKSDQNSRGISDLIRALVNTLSHPSEIIRLSKKALNVWRREGWAGVKSSILLYTNYFFETNEGDRDSRINSLYHYLRSGKKETFPDMKDIPETYRPKVSVIVPNFNHGAYLQERLTSIYEQTYKNFEVILLDDCSTDDSVSILKKYAEENPEKTRCYFNDTNSGSPFSQWEKGISLAEGDLIWIAESDDFCEKNFLEKLVPLFFNDSILLSYAHNVFVDAKGTPHTFAFESYVSQVNPKKWRASYIETAHNEVNTALGLINSIPNVSGVLFRKLDHHFPLFNDPEWKKMRVCGDWLFYLHLIRGGSVAFSRDTHNYYRMYPSSTSKKTHSHDIYYQEHEQVALAIASLYKIPIDLLIRLQARLRDFYFKNVEYGSTEKFDELFDLNKITQSKQKRKPNVLMAAYALTFGGGEIFPVRLANALYKAGAAVTLFNGEYEPTQSGVRRMVSPQIAVVNNQFGFPVNDMLEKFGIEVIHSHHASMDNFFAVTRRIGSTSTKHIVTMHGMYEMMGNFMPNTRAIRRSVEHWVYTADKNILPFTKHNLFTAEKFTKIENGLPSPNVQKVDLGSLGITTDSFTACLATRALPDKGWFEAIKATEKTREVTKKDVHLLLIGEGPVYDLLKKEQLPEFIHLLGYISNLDDYIASTQLGLLPTYFKGESFPLILIQFFMAGLPVIASNIAEISRMIKVDEEQMGAALIELYNGKVTSDDLAEVMIKMVTDRDFYDKHAAVAHLLKDRFDIDNIAQQYLALYKRTLGYEL